MTKYLIVAIVALTLALGGALWLARHEAQNAAYATIQAKTANEQLEATQARLGAIQKQVVASDKKLAQAQQELRNALKENKEWADGRVPDAVRDSLCKYTLCGPSSAPAVPATGDPGRQ